VRLQKRRVLGSAVLGLGAAMVITGCGAGQVTQTASEQPAVNGAYAQVGKIVVRDAEVANRETCDQAYTPGSQVPLEMTIVNNAAQDDELVSAGSDLTGGAVIGGSKVVPSVGSLVVAAPNASAAEAQQSGQPTGAPTSAPSSSSSRPSAPGASSTPAGPGATGGKAAPTIGRGTIVLQGLKGVLWPGQNLTATLTFRNAGVVTVQLPIAPPSHPLRCGTVHTEQGEH
jgi:copper(I)-binding protein